MNVFVYDNVNNRLEINEGEIFLITEFKNLLNKDQSKDKELAFKELTYIQHLIGKVHIHNIQNQKDMKRPFEIQD